jgi:hypothetical protein
MAPPKVKNPKKSAANYRKNAASRAKKAAYDKKYHSSDSRKEYRAELQSERRKRGVAGKGGKDMSHTKSGNIVAENASKNRARNRGKK